MRVRSGLLLLSLLLAVGLAATILLTREPTPIATASVPDPPAETPQALPRTQTPTNPLCENGTAVPSPAANPGLVADCSALLAAQDTLRGTATLNWSADAVISSWDGITLAGTPQRVTKLRLTYKRLDGAIPPELGDLEKLEWLYLFGNRLTGTIPAALGSLGELEILYLHYNQLTGSIPPEFGALSSLRWLDLDTNDLTGPIPVELTTLPALQDLYLDNNALTGSIPAGLVDRDLRTLYLGGNSGLTGCIPAGLRGVLDDPARLTLSYCTTTTTYLLTTTAGTGGRTSPLPGTYRYFDGASVTVTATPNPYYNMGTWGGDCSGTAATCTLTLDAAKTASVSFQIQTYALTVTATGGGTVSPTGTTTQNGGTELTLTASWNDATHTFTGWSGDCSGSETTCALLIDAAKTVTATFAALPADRCATMTAADCIRAVYKGAPDDYAQVQEIPADRLLTPGSDGRYTVDRGQQITVVTAARLPTGYTRFYLQRRPPGVAGTPDPVSFTQLIKPVGTTYTFTVTSDEAGRTLFTFDLQAAKPPLRPGLKPQLGDRVVTTTFQVTTTTMRYTTYDTTGAATTPGSYAFLTDPDDLTTAITTYEGLRTGLRDGTTIGLVMHQNDGDGASHEAFYDLVEANDVVEWREAADCWMRYVIREVHADPTGDPPRKLLTLQIYSHADTGCSGTLGPTGTRTFTWTPESIRTGTIQTFFTHGAFVVVPEGWTGTRPTVTSLPMIDTPWPPDPIPAPDLGDGWQGGIDHDSYTDALYIRFSRGNERVSGYIYRLRAWPRDIISHSNNPGPRTARNEWGVLDGRPVEIATPGLGVTSHFVSDVAVYVYDPATGLLYVILVEFNPPPGADPIEAAIDLVRKFLPAAP